MNRETDNRETATEELTVIIRQRTFNLMSTGRMMCSEAVLSVLNQGLGGGLPPDVAMKVASGFPEGIGGSGCTCGTLTGCVIALGLFLSQGDSNLAAHRKAMDASGRLHRDFKSRFGSTCCRVLIKKGSSEIPHHFEVCCERGGWAAEHAARMILAERPELAPQADQAFLRRKNSRIAVILKKFLFGFFALFYHTRAFKEGNEWKLK
ncbi:MAG: C_GCAxxG_C_C family protein [Deltaproteobacteria bacterium]|nr:C_GCAxxG_C_C family protein [Deltaproteobacteria bacterium]